MIKLKLNELEEGMVFSKPLYTEDSELVIHGGLPLKKSDVNRLRAQNVVLVYSFGDILKKKKPVITGEKSDIQRIKDDLKKKIEAHSSTTVERERPDVMPEKKPSVTISEISSKSEIEKKNLYENKISNLGFYEKLIDDYSVALNNFVKDKTTSDTFKKTLVDISEALVGELSKDPYPLLDIASFIETGNTHATHSIRVAIVAVYLGIIFECPKRRLINIAVGSILHDVGKITYFRINEKENLKVSKDMINLPITHPIYGFKTAKDLLILHDEICQIILHHHEQPDGRGFPRRVDNMKLSLSDKIVYTANLFANLIQNTNFNGYGVALKQIKYLGDTYADKFDMTVLKKLFSLRDNRAYDNLHSTGTDEISQPVSP